jgi:methionine-rich copper-binding protein CopC
VGFVVLALILSGAAGVETHSFLDRADPRAGSTVKVAPAQVRLWFTESLEPAFSAAQVLNEAGQRVDRADSQVDSSDPALLRVSLPPLTPGTYKVFWRVLSVDSHVTEGDFTFRVAP